MGLSLNIDYKQHWQNLNDRIFIIIDIDTYNKKDKDFIDGRVLREL